LSVGRSFCACVSLVALCSGLGCVSMPTGASLGRAEPATKSVPRGAWLAPVVISDPSARGATENQRQLTLAIEGYVQQAGYFSRVNLLPGEPSSDEYVLGFVFDRYELRREIHPMYVPLALITLGIYIWAGGPIYRDVTHFSASLSVADTSGKELLRYADHVDDEGNVSLWSPRYALPTSSAERTRLVRSLLEQAAYGLTAHATQ